MSEYSFYIGVVVLRIRDFAYYSQNPDPRVTSGDTAFFVFVSTKLPAPIPGLIMAAMLAAVMSTLDSGINSLSAIWLKEYHEKYINRKMTDRQQVKVSRISTTLFGVFAIVIGLIVSVPQAGWDRRL